MNRYRLRPITQRVLATLHYRLATLDGTLSPLYLGCTDVFPFLLLRVIFDEGGLFFLLLFVSANSVLKGKSMILNSVLNGRRITAVSDSTVHTNMFL